jgi:uncharacterized protein (DUF433 family)
MSRRIIGRYLVADDAICHGKPTFRGTRIMVWQVLELVAQGMDWDEIIWEFHGSITKEAITEVVNLASSQPASLEQKEASLWPEG